MKLFIQIKDGQPYEHPIMDWNMKDAFPDVNLYDLPPQFANFERVECDIEVGVYEIAEVSYQWVGNVVKDVWSKRPMTLEERTEKDMELISLSRSFAESSFRDTNLNGTVPDVII